MKTSSQLISFLRATTLALCFIPFSQHAQAESEPLLRGVASPSGVALTPMGGGAATAARGDHMTVEGAGGYVPPPSARGGAAAGHVAVDVAVGGAGGYVPPPSARGASAAAGHVAVDVAAAAAAAMRGLGYGNDGAATAGDVTVTVDAAGGAGAALVSPHPRMDARGGAGGGGATVSRRLSYEDTAAVDVASVVGGGAGAHTGYGPAVDALLAELPREAAVKALTALNHLTLYLQDKRNNADLSEFLNSYEGQTLETLPDLLLSNAYTAVDGDIIPIYLRSLRKKTEGLQAQLREILDSLATSLKVDRERNPTRLLGIIEGMQAAHASELQRLQHALEAALAAARAPVVPAAPGEVAIPVAAAERVAPQIQSGNRYINFIKTWGGWCVAIGLSGALTWLKLSGKIN